MPVDEIDAFSGDPNFMTSLARGLAVLQAFDLRQRSLTVSQVSQATGIPRAAARRCLYTLLQLGYVAEQHGHFSLRPKVLTLGFAHLSSRPLAAAAQPLLDRCRDRLHESCSLALLDGGEVYYQARAETTRIMSIALYVGTRLPAYCTSMGRVLLAALPEDELDKYLARTTLHPRTVKTVTSVAKLREILVGVRRQGYALVDQELEVGLRSIAVPVFDRHGHVVAALNTGTQAARTPLRDLTQLFLPELRAAAAELRQ
ncbi:IclR family transcriptional regulator domain-containing protein [Solimonas marina]|uniref:Helix-turn-helix domain-containing protein n=1 Tax=Solimonas marina TaxID=2714601 RepID=A0A969WC07_9GAMM|nr:IclR family transcriptional regulator C-terminal domain-containing protein [Solimonas marina]NKF23759.1 helix-turn-helix domain-containing protein [Solimonas marina]